MANRVEFIIRGRFENKISPDLKKTLAEVQSTVRSIGDATISAFHKISAHAAAAASSIGRSVGSVLKIAGSSISFGFNIITGAISFVMKVFTSLVSFVISGFTRMVHYAKWFGLALIATTGYMVKLGLDAVRTENAFTVAMGAMSEAARAWSETMAHELRLSGDAIRGFLASMQLTLESMGMFPERAYEMSKGLVQLTYDLATFYGMAPADVFDALQQAIMGNQRALRTLGIAISDAAVDAYAIANGIGAVEEKQGKYVVTLTESQKAMAIYGVLTERTAKMHGELAKSAAGPIAMIQSIWASVKDMAQMIGTGIVKSRTFGAVVTWISSLFFGLKERLAAIDIAGLIDEWSARFLAFLGRIEFINKLWGDMAALISRVREMDFEKIVSDWTQAIAAFYQKSMGVFGEIKSAALDLIGIKVGTKTETVRKTKIVYEVDASGVIRAHTEVEMVTRQVQKTLGDLSWADAWNYFKDVVAPKIGAALQWIGKQVVAAMKYVSSGGAKADWLSLMDTIGKIGGFIMQLAPLGGLLLSIAKYFVIGLRAVDSIVIAIKNDMQYLTNKAKEWFYTILAGIEKVRSFNKLEFLTPGMQPHETAAKEYERKAIGAGAAADAAAARRVQEDYDFAGFISAMDTADAKLREFFEGFAKTVESVHARLQKPETLLTGTDTKTVAAAQEAVKKGPRPSDLQGEMVDGVLVIKQRFVPQIEAASVQLGGFEKQVRNSADALSALLDSLAYSASVADAMRETEYQQQYAPAPASEPRPASAPVYAGAGVPVAPAAASGPQSVAFNFPGMVLNMPKSNDPEKLSDDFMRAVEYKLKRRKRIGWEP